MSEIERASIKKARLGRGLGSLLETHIKIPDAANEAFQNTPHPTAVKTAPTKPVTIAPQQVAVQPSKPEATLQPKVAVPQKPVAAPIVHKSAHPAQVNAVAQAKPSNSVVAPQTQQPVSVQPVQSAPTPKPPQPQVTVASPIQAPLEIPEEMRIWKIPIEKLSANAKQPRQMFDPTLIKELADSIKEQGILQPLIARRIAGGTYQIIAGERRWRAAQVAGLREVPVILKGVDDQRSLELALIENIQRADLNPIEESKAYDQLSKVFQMSHQEIATRVGKDRVTVTNALRLLALATEVQDMLMDGEISAGHAKVLLALEDTTQQVDLARRIRTEKLSVRALEREVKRVQKGGVQGPSIALSTSEELKSRLVANISEELQKTLGTKVTIDYDNSKGKIAIHFYSDEQFNQVVEKLRK